MCYNHQYEFSVQEIHHIHGYNGFGVWFPVKETITQKQELRKDIENVLVFLDCFCTIGRKFTIKMITVYFLLKSVLFRENACSNRSTPFTYSQNRKATRLEISDELLTEIHLEHYKTLISSSNLVLSDQFFYHSSITVSSIYLL